MIDDSDRRWLEHVRPPGWRNPSPKTHYDLVVIGGGTAGLVCAAGAAGLGAHVALVERHRLGGDCLNTGCVPSKALLRSAYVVGEANRGVALGVTAAVAPEFGAVMHRLRARRADIAPNDSAARLTSLGVDVFFGSASFSGRRTITVTSARPSRNVSDPNESNIWDLLKVPNDSNDSNDPNDPSDLTLHFRKAVIATGSAPAIPSIAGLADVRFLTSETIFELTRQPSSLIVLGGGPLGCELAQAFARLGTHVTLVESGPRLLPREDADAAEIVTQRLEEDGVLIVNARVGRVSQAGDHVRVRGGGADLLADEVLVATGRTARTADLGLEQAGIAAGEDGIQVNDRLQTTNSRVYASGDVCSRYKFTHAADALSRIVVQNALFHGRKRASALVIPWCTFTDPEVAHVGLNMDEANANGCDTITIPMREVDRAVVDEQTEGFVRLHHERGRIRGATIVAPHAGELIGIVAFAMQQGVSLEQFAGTVFPYPTLSMALRQAGDTFRRERLTPGVRRALGYYFGRA